MIESFLAGVVHFVLGTIATCLDTLNTLLLHPSELSGLQIAGLVCFALWAWNDLQNER